MTLTWGLPQNDSDDGILRNYVVDCGSDGDQSFALDMMLSADSEKRVVLQNLDPYTAYTCCLLVETDMGSSPLACTAETTLEEGVATKLASYSLHHHMRNRKGRYSCAPLVYCLLPLLGSGSC